MNFIFFFLDVITNSTKNAPQIPKPKNFLFQQIMTPVLMYIFHVELFGKAKFSSPCIVEK